MAWSGGVFTRLNGATGWVDDANAFIGIEAGRHDTQDNDFKDGINSCLNKDGSNSATGNLNLGGYRYTNSAAATARTDLAQVAQVQDSSYIWLGTTAGTATAQTASATPAITAYAAGQKFRMLVGSGLGSTGASATGHTLAVNGLAAKQIVSADGLNTSPTIGSWVEGAILELVYDGTYFRITNDPGGWLNYTITTSNLTGTAPNVVNSITSSNTRFRKTGKTVFLEMSVQIDLSVGGANTLNLTPPVNAGSSISSTNMFFTPGNCIDATASTIGFAYFTSATNLQIAKNVLASTAWTAGTGTYLRLAFSYESV